MSVVKHMGGIAPLMLQVKSTCAFESLLPTKAGLTIIPVSSQRLRPTLMTGLLVDWSRLASLIDVERPA